jgi:hypothetical protein
MGAARLNVEREPPLQLPVSGVEVSVPAGAYSVDLKGARAMLAISFFDDGGKLLGSTSVPYTMNGGASIPRGSRWVRIAPPIDCDRAVEVEVTFLIGHRAAGCTTRPARRL